MIRLLVDAGVLGGLVLALVLVLAVDKLLPIAGPQQPQQVVQTQSVTTQQAGKTLPTRPKELRLAVTPSYQDPKFGPWDDMTKLLRTLGEGYKFKEVKVQTLLNDATKFDDFDVLFLTCAPGDTDREFVTGLRNFVARGGTLYASDWRYDSVAAAFQEVVAQHLQGEGRAQILQANVVDPGLRDLVGPTVPLKFDLDKWKPAAFAGDRVKVLLEGTYRREFGMGKAPLLVKFEFGKGTVIFTSFHNEKQNSEIEQKLLKYLVFSVVTAQTERQVIESLVKGGFSPQKQNLLSASTGENPKVTYNYHSTKAGKISFALAFEDRGAKIRLIVVSPTAETLEHVGTSSFVLEGVSTGPGDWQYTVEALTVPFRDFPFTVTVAEWE